VDKDAVIAEDAVRRAEVGSIVPPQAITEGTPDQGGGLVCAPILDGFPPVILA
jgi:hypothetical protein